MTGLSAIAVVALLLALNAFFVGAEFALVAARRTQIEPRAVAGSRVARTTLHAMERVSLMMAGAQLGITVCSLGLGAVAEPAVAGTIEPAMDAAGVPHAWLHPIAFVIAIILVTALHVVLGEMVPKNITLAGPERAALLLGPPLAAIVTILKPVVVVLNTIANGVLRLLRVQPRDEVSTAFTREEMAGLVEESHREGLLETDEYDLLAAALGFTERTVESVLLPTAELATVPAGSRVGDVERLCRATGFSRFPVAAGTGSLVGYLHVKDVLGADPAQSAQPIDRWVRALATVPHNARLHDALTAMRSRGAHLARVVRPDGEELGVVALEDVLEELVGEIRDVAHA